MIKQIIYDNDGICQRTAWTQRSDGIVDITDTRFNELKLWIDSNGDGVTDTNGEGIMRDVLFRYENNLTNQVVNNQIHQKAA
jgi:hypothetical protein